MARTNGTTSYLIVQGGRLVWEFGDTRVPAPLYSVRKSIASILYGIASDLGQVNLGRTLSQLGIDDVKGLSDTERTATIRHLLTARSCIYHEAAYARDQESRRPERHSCKPGEQFFYNNWDFNALGTIYHQITGRALFDAFEAELAGPLQLEHFRKKAHTRWHYESVSTHPAYLFQLSARDMARNGDWCGNRIVSERWIGESTTAASETKSPDTGYGYLWWVGEKGKLFRTHFKGHAFSARGNGGQYIVERIRLAGGVAELLDAAVLPGVRRPGATKRSAADLSTLISIDGAWRLAALTAKARGRARAWQRVGAAATLRRPSLPALPREPCASGMRAGPGPPAARRPCLVAVLAPVAARERTKQARAHSARSRRQSRR